MLGAENPHSFEYEDGAFAVNEHGERIEDYLTDECAQGPGVDSGPRCHMCRAWLAGWPAVKGYYACCVLEGRSASAWPCRHANSRRVLIEDYLTDERAQGSLLPSGPCCHCRSVAGLLCQATHACKT